MSDPINFINNLLSRLETLKTEVDNSDSLVELTDSQRSVVSSLIDTLSYSLDKYSQSNYGCCQEICDTKVCFDAPAGYNTAELLEKVSFLLNLSNLGVNKLPSNSKFKQWWHSVDNNMAQSFIGEYVVPVVDWLFESVGLDKPTNSNLEELTYAGTVGLIYIVFGDPVLFFQASERFKNGENIDSMLDLIAKDVFALEVSSWERVLEDLNEVLTKNLTDGEAANITITKDSVHELFSWILGDLQSGINQTSANDDCTTSFGMKFPNYPGAFWILANTLLAVVGSFLIAGARGQFGKKADGSVRWIPPFGFKDSGGAAYSDLFEDSRSPFRGFAVKNAYVENLGAGPIIVQFTEEISNELFDYNHASIGNPDSYSVSVRKSDGTTSLMAVSVTAHQEERDKVQLHPQSLTDGEYGTDWYYKVKLGSDDTTPMYNDVDEVDLCPPFTQNWALDGARREIGIENSFSGTTFSDFIAWAVRLGDDTFERSFNYLVDWHQRNLQSEFVDAFNALQSIGWMNLKGNDFGGFLHPDAACGPFVEGLFCEYFNTIEPDCVTVKIEESCGVFKCEFDPDVIAEQIKQLESEIKSLLESGQAAQDARDAERAEYEKNKAKIEADISQATSDLESLQAQYESECQTDPDSPACQDLNKQINQLEENIKALIEDIKALEQADAEAQEAYEQFSELIKSNIEIFEENINTLNEQLESGVISSDWSDVCVAGSDAVVVTKNTSGGVGSNLSSEAAFLFHRIDGIRAYGGELELCVVDCPDCGTIGCEDELVKKLISELKEASASLTDLENQQTDLLNERDKLLDEMKANSEAYDALGCPQSDATDCSVIEQALADAAQRVEEINTELEKLASVISDVTKSVKELQAQIKECQESQEDCSDGVWKIIRKGTDASDFTTECLLGWSYTEDGDIVVDESEPAHGISMISLPSKPDTLLIDKSGDVYADGVLVARVALSSIADAIFSDINDLTLPSLLIHPKFIGNKRIFHIMQEGFHVICEDPNSLRNELGRHELIPYPIGRFFQGDPCCDTEPEECEELWCCGNPDLPDCFDLGDCPVTIPDWFKSWYEEHREYLILKLPYDKRFEGDPLRYSRDEQIAFAAAVIDLVVRYFNSTPVTVESGFENWSDMKRILNILPVVEKNNPSNSRFSIDNWVFGRNSNSPEIELPLELDENGDLVACVDCCELIDSDCEVIETFEDCCESACGRWSKDCSYKAGDIVFGLSGESCYRALIDVCAGDCNPEPGAPMTEDTWENCTPDCETTAPRCEFQLSSDYTCNYEGCDATVSIGAQFSVSDDNSSQICEYRWIYRAVNAETGAEVTVEDFGKYPGENSYDILEIVLPLYTQECESPNLNTWSVFLEARSKIGDEILTFCGPETVSIDINCDFVVDIWEGTEKAKADAYGWCDDVNSDNPNAKRSSAPSSELGNKLKITNQAAEELYMSIDTDPNDNRTTDEENEIKEKFNALGTSLFANGGTIDKLSQAQGLPYDFSSVSASWYQRGAVAQELLDEGKYDQAIESIQQVVVNRAQDGAPWGVTDYIKANGIYAGAEECCCVVLKPTHEDNTCDMSWVWLVDSGVGTPIPYYGGVGKTAEETVACAIRNPDQNGNTQVNVTLLSYPATCDEIIRGRVKNWDGSLWYSDVDGFTADPLCVCSFQTSISCPCAPRGGIVDFQLIECDPNDDNMYEVYARHCNILNDCEVQWTWQLAPNDGGSVITFDGGFGTEALEIPRTYISSGTQYEVILVWENAEFNTTGNVFTQTVDVPVCPRLDFTNNFSGDSFRATSYGDISVSIDNIEDLSIDEYNILGSAYGSGSQGVEIPFTVSNNNPDGEVSLTLAHTPNTQDPKWLAVKTNKYQWRWQVKSTGDYIKETDWAFSQNNKSPNLDMILDSNQIGIGFNYSVRLQAKDIGTGAIQSGEWVVAQNPRYKGRRQLEGANAISRGQDPVPTNFSVALNTVTGEGTLYYIPMLNWDGRITEQFSVAHKLGSEQAQSIVTDVDFWVTNDPCLIENKPTIYIDPTIVSASKPLDGEEYGTVTYNVGFEWRVNPECGNLYGNLANQPEIKFTYIVENSPGKWQGSWQDITSLNNAEMTDGSTIQGEFEFDLKHYIGDNSALFAIKCIIADGTDNPIEGEGDRGTVEGYQIFTFNNPYSQCIDGSWVASEGVVGDDGQPDGCPCVPLEINQSLYGWDGNVRNMILDSHQRAISLTGHIKSGTHSIGDIEYAIKSDNSNPTDFSSYIVQENPEAIGPASQATLWFTADGNLGANFSKTMSVTITAFDTRRFDNLSEAEAEDCDLEFTLNVPLLSGCLTPGTADYVEDANIEPVGNNIDCRETVMGCTNPNSPNYRPDTDDEKVVDNGCCAPWISDMETFKNHIRDDISNNSDLNRVDTSKIVVAPDADGSYLTANLVGSLYDGSDQDWIDNAIDIPHTHDSDRIQGVRIDITDGALEYPDGHGLESGGKITLQLDRLLEYPQGTTASDFTFRCDISKNAIESQDGEGWVEWVDDPGDEGRGVADLDDFGNILNIRFGKYSHSRQSLLDNTTSFSSDKSSATQTANYQNVAYVVYVVPKGSCGEESVADQNTLAFFIRVRLSPHTFTSGCMDNRYDNYSADNVIDADNCVKAGCTDKWADNYDSLATDNDGTCSFGLPKLKSNASDILGDAVEISTDVEQTDTRLTINVKEDAFAGTTDKQDFGANYSVVLSDLIDFSDTKNGSSVWNISIDGMSGNRSTARFPYGEGVTESEFYVQRIQEDYSTDGDYAVFGPRGDNNGDGIRADDINIRVRHQNFGGSFSSPATAEEFTFKIRTNLHSQKFKLGCTDPNALNTDDDAIINNGTCCYKPGLKSSDDILTIIQDSLDDSSSINNTQVDRSKIAISKVTNNEYDVLFKNGAIKEQSINPANVGGMFGFNSKTVFDLNSEESSDFRSELWISDNSCNDDTGKATGCNTPNGGPDTESFYSEKSNGHNFNFRFGNYDYHRIYLVAQTPNTTAKTITFEPTYTSVQFVLTAWFAGCKSSGTKTFKVNMKFENQVYSTACVDSNKCNGVTNKSAWQHDGNLCEDYNGCCWSTSHFWDGLNKDSVPQVDGYTYLHRTRDGGHSLLRTDVWDSCRVQTLRKLDGNDELRFSLGGHGMYHTDLSLEEKNLLILWREKVAELNKYTAALGQIDCDKHKEACAQFQTQISTLNEELKAIYEQVSHLGWRTGEYGAYNGLHWFEADEPGVKKAAGMHWLLSISRGFVTTKENNLAKAGPFDAKTLPKGTDVSEEIANQINDLIQYMESITTHTNCDSMRDAARDMAERIFDLGEMKVAPKDGALNDVDLQACYDNDPNHSWVTALNIGKWTLNNVTEWFLSGVLEDCYISACDKIPEVDPGVVIITKGGGSDGGGGVTSGDDSPRSSTVSVRVIDDVRTVVKSSDAAAATTSTTTSTNAALNDLWKL